MALNGKTNEEKIWFYFKSKGFNDYGIAGIMGNIRCESNFNPKNLQSNGNRKLGMTDDEFVVALDNGVYTKEQFIYDKYGYGISQWTYHSRKKAFYEYVKSSGKSFGDLETQLDYLYKELSQHYKSVFNTLKTATSVKQASNAVMLKYERPADQSETAQNKRASYGQQYYDKYAGSNVSQESGGGSMKIKVNDIIALFKKMYKEHWSYVWGSARKGCVDCSGAFVYAYKQLNGSYIYHGSNAIARKYVGDLQPISAAKPGWAAFKWKKNGAPSKYTDGKGNYYHIGLVDETGKYVLHAKGAAYGFRRDPIKTWHYVAPLNEVDYNESITNNNNTTVLYQATVVTQSGSLNLRNAPNGTRIGTIPRNSVVDVLNNGQSDWWQIRYKEKIGYANTKYLVRNTSINTEGTVDTNKNENYSNFNVDDEVKLIQGATYVSGKPIPSWVFDKTLYIRILRDDNAVVSTLRTGAITGTVALKYLTKQNSINAPYDVKVTVNSLNIRKGAGINYATNGRIKDQGIYTIVAEANGKGATKWLKLKDGSGWISSDYTVKV